MLLCFCALMGGQGGYKRMVAEELWLSLPQISGQLSPRLFRKLPPRVCVSLKNIVDEDFLYAGHIFLGFSKCGRYVLSYTSSSGDDDFSFYIYHLYWWEFNVHSKLKLVRQVRLFQDEEIYSDLYLTVCEWPSDASKVIVFGFNTRSANGMLMNMMMMSDENHRDIYISTVAVPPRGRCTACQDASRAHPGDPSAQCLRHGFMLHTKYQVVYPFPTFQPAFQLKKDQVVLLNTSYSLVACAVSVHSAGRSRESIHCQLLAVSGGGGLSAFLAVGPDLCQPRAGPLTSATLTGKPAPGHSLLSRFQLSLPDVPGDSSFCQILYDHTASPLAPPTQPGPAAEAPAPEPGYVNYTKLYYVLESGEGAEPEDEFEDDKISLPFVVTDLRGRNLRPMRERTAVQGQYLTVEQLTLDFEYVINEVIRHDATWGHQFCSFSDYDIVILEVFPETSQVLINIGLLLLAFPSPSEEGQLRPKTYHTSLKVAWDLNTGIFETVSVGDLTEVKGQTSGSVWSSYRKSCVDMVMKWLVPESSGRYVNRMTNEALHKGCSLKVLADSERYTWIVL
uniref:DDB1 and CUL4 associated factor 15 n=1 Tax=Spermophilus dauricus TaxID=99837 RepID=A0A8C9PE52_SPEDA